MSFSVDQFECGGILLYRLERILGFKTGNSIFNMRKVAVFSIKEVGITMKIWIETYMILVEGALPNK